MSARRNTLAGRPTILIRRPTPAVTLGAAKGLLLQFLRVVRGIPNAARVILRAARDLLFVALILVAGCGDPAAPIPVASIVVTPGPASLHSIGETVQLTAVAKDAAGNVIEGREFTWSSTSSEVATVNAGALVQAVADGQVTITAASGGVTGSTTISVAQKVASVEILPASRQFASWGETVELTAIARDANGHSIAGKVAEWGSSAPGVVAVNATTGVATSVTDGQAVITATIDGSWTTSTLTVDQLPAKLVFLGPPFTTQNGVNIPGISVMVQDALGTRVSSATNKVTISIETNPATGVIAGTTELAPNGGLVTFNALAIDKPAVGYTLKAVSPGLTSATSPAFEIMDVPARIDSVKLSSTNLKVGTSTAYSVWVTNGAGRNLTLAGVQGYIIQGTVLHGAGGSQATGCSPTGGVIPHGSCKLNWAFSLNGGGYTAGPAEGRIELFEGGAKRAAVTLPVTIVP